MNTVPRELKNDQLTSDYFGVQRQQKCLKQILEEKNIDSPRTKIQSFTHIIAR